MIQITQLKMPLHHTNQDISNKISRLLHIPVADAANFHILKKSLDARKKPDLKWVYTIGIEHKQEKKIMKKIHNNNIMSTTLKKYAFSPSGTQPLQHPPVVIGSGPAGLFCTYMLALYGYHPILIERGEPMEQRQKSVENFWNNGTLNTESNVQFGEGGAGTFSDGKLNTQVNDKWGRDTFVVNTFISFGAPESIAYDNHPHIGTDILSTTIVNMRNKIKELGGTIYFNTKFTDYTCQENQLTSITVQSTADQGQKWEIPTQVAVLAIGHSARDTFRMLYEHHLPMEAKPFAVGMRVEHPQELINTHMYGENHPKDLPAAPYKLTARTSNHRNVYSFCMCPGGYVVNASSQNNRIAVNGMSYSGRNGENANSAIIVNVTPTDFPDSSPLSGLSFQEKLEENAYTQGQGKLPVQRLEDFCKNRESTCAGSICPNSKGEVHFTNLRPIFTEELNQAFMEGMEQFNQKIPGFSHPDTILTGVESRTSSPVRILRNQEFTSHVEGLYPCGEGAGYAGGITSAAMDGIKVFEAIAKKYMTDTQK